MNLSARQRKVRSSDDARLRQVRPKRLPGRRGLSSSTGCHTIDAVCLFTQAGGEARTRPKAAVVDGWTCDPAARRQRGCSPTGGRGGHSLGRRHLRPESPLFHVKLDRWSAGVGGDGPFASAVLTTDLERRKATVSRETCPVMGEEGDPSRRASRLYGLQNRFVWVPGIGQRNSRGAPPAVEHVPTFGLMPWGRVGHFPGLPD